MLQNAFILDKRGVARVTTIGDPFRHQNDLRPALNVQVRNTDEIKRSQESSLLVLVRSHGARDQDFYRIGHIPLEKTIEGDTVAQFPGQNRCIARQSSFFWKCNGGGSGKAEIV